MKKTALMFVVLMSMVVLSLSAFALPAEISEVEVEGVELQENATSGLDEFDTDTSLDIRVRLEATGDIEDATLRVFVEGYEYETLTDSARIYNLKSGRAKTYDLNVELPQLLQSDKEYQLRVYLADANSDTMTKDYDFAVGQPEHSLVISDIVFFDDNEVMPGEAFYVTARVKNLGDGDGDNAEESVKVTVDVPALGIKSSDYIDEIEEDDSETSPEIYMRVPDTATAGEYDAIVTLKYNNGYETTSKVTTLKVLEKQTVEEEPKDMTLVSATIEPQRIKVGSTGVYPITISNVGNEAKTYTITIETASDWATFEVSPSNLVLLDSKEAKTVYMYVTPKQGASEENLFVVTISDGNEAKQVALQTDVVASADERSDADEKSGFRRALEIGLIVLVVLLVIVGLIVAFTKLASRDDDFEDDEDDETTQTYY